MMRKKNFGNLLDIMIKICYIIYMSEEDLHNARKNKSGIGPIIIF